MPRPRSGLGLNDSLCSGAAQRSFVTRAILRRSRAGRENQPGQARANGGCAAAFLLWRALATIWPKRLPNVGSLFHAVPRGDQFLPKDLAKPKIFLWPRITPELSRTTLRRRQSHNLTRLCRRREAVSA